MIKYVGHERGWVYSGMECFKPRLEVEELVCDLCGDTVDALYWADENHDEQLCEACLLQRNRVEVE